MPGAFKDVATRFSLGVGDRVSQVPVEVIVAPTSEQARASQGPVEAVVLPTSVKARASQVVVEVIVLPPVVTFKDAATRTRITAASFKDVAARTRLTVASFKDVAARTRITAASFKDVAARLRFAAPSFKDAATRFRFSTDALRDIALRLRLSAVASKNPATRFSLSLPTAVKDVATRVRLAVARTVDASVRFLVRVRAYGDSGARLWATARAYRDATARFRVSVRNYRDVATRFRTTPRSFKDPGARFRINAAPLAPTIYGLTPVSPNVYQRQGFSLQAYATDPSDSVAMEWSYSTNSGTSWIVAGSSSFVASGVSVTYGWRPPLPVSGAVRLRVRAVDSQAAYSAYTTQTANWTLADAPVASVTAPAPGSILRYDQSQTFSWDYSSANASAQSAYALKRRHVVTNAVAWWRASDSTWQATETWNATATASATFTADTWTNHRSDAFGFQVAVKDSHTTPLVSAYTSEQLVTWSVPIDPTITDPTVGGPAITVATYTVVWTVSEQTRYRVRILDGAVVLADSGIMSDPIPRSLAIGPARESSVTYELTTWNLEQLPSNVQTVAKTVTFSASPNQPTVVGSALVSPLRVRLVVTNPAGGTSVTANEVWKSSSGSGGPYAKIGTVAVNGTYDDQEVQPSTAYSYFVRALGANGTYRDSA